MTVVSMGRVARVGRALRGRDARPIYRGPARPCRGDDARHIRALPERRLPATDLYRRRGRAPGTAADRGDGDVSATTDRHRFHRHRADQVDAAINCPISLPESAAFCAIRCLSQEDIPNCEGYLRPITVRAPEGCLLNPLYPAACGARGVVGYRVFDAIMQALAQVVPERAIGGSEGGPYLLAAGGRHEGRPSC